MNINKILAKPHPVWELDEVYQHWGIQHLAVVNQPL
jgi:hypothetical protein